jgi:hypothetical protein
LDAAYELTKHLTVALGASNRFNLYSDKNGIQDWGAATNTDRSHHLDLVAPTTKHGRPTTSEIDIVVRELAPAGLRSDP